jgi:hypothetical protein
MEQIRKLEWNSSMTRTSGIWTMLLLGGLCLKCDAAQDPALPAKAPASLRQVINFNRDFLFRLGVQKDGERPSLDDSAWEPIGLPHSFSIPYFRASTFYVGEGWYRKRFTVPTSWAGKQVRLECEGAFQHTSVYLNGVPAGRHDGGYTAFDIDLTPLVKTGENLLAVRVDNRWDPVLPPRAGEHVFYGGIYRDVRLVGADPLHIPRNGVWVTRPEVSRDRALVKVAVTLSNEGRSPRSCAVRATLLAPDGKTLVAQATTENRSIAAGQTVAVDSPEMVVGKPLLWHPDHPSCYSLRVALVDKEGRSTRPRSGPVFAGSSLLPTRDSSSMASPCACRAARRWRTSSRWSKPSINPGTNNLPAQLTSVGPSVKKTIPSQL